MASQTHDLNSTRTSTSRRSLIGMLATAAAAVSIPATARGIPIAARAAVQEKPEILALGDTLSVAMERYRTAQTTKGSALELAKALRPPVPEELVVSREDEIIFGGRFSKAGCAEEEVDLEGKTVYGAERIREDGQKVIGRPRLILRAERLRNSSLYSGIGPRTKLGKKLKALIKIAEKYEADVQAAKEPSGLNDATSNLYFAARDVEDVGAELRTHHEPITMAGVVIFARALLAAKEVQSTTKTFFGDYIGNHLAAALVRVAENPGVAGSVP